MGWFKQYVVLKILNLDSVVIRRRGIASAALILFIISLGPFNRDCWVSHCRPSVVTYTRDLHKSLLVAVPQKCPLPKETINESLWL